MGVTMKKGPLDFFGLFGVILSLIMFIVAVALFVADSNAEAQRERITNSNSK